MRIKKQNGFLKLIAAVWVFFSTLILIFAVVLSIKILHRVYTAHVNKQIEEKHVEDYTDNVQKDIESAVSAVKSYYAEYHKYPKFPITIFNKDQTTIYYDVAKHYIVSKPNKFAFTIHYSDVISIVDSESDKDLYEITYKTDENGELIKEKVYCLGGYEVKVYSANLDPNNDPSGSKQRPYIYAHCVNKFTANDSFM
jgi:hypothetical protein